MHVLKAVIYIYTHGYMHLDIKLENIIFNDKTKKVTIVDMGSVHPKTDKLAALQYNAGTKEYAAPEIYLYYYHHTSDIYSIGCLYWILLTGTTLYKITNKKLAFSQIPEQFPTEKHEEKFNSLNNTQQEFLKKTLQKNYKKRITYKEILDLPFINNCINDLNL